VVEHPCRPEWGNRCCGIPVFWGGVCGYVSRFKPVPYENVRLIFNYFNLANINITSTELPPRIIPLCYFFYFKFFYDKCLNSPYDPDSREIEIWAIYQQISGCVWDQKSTMQPDYIQTTSRLQYIQPYKSKRSPHCQSASRHSWYQPLNGSALKSPPDYSCSSPCQLPPKVGHTSLESPAHT